MNQEKKKLGLGISRIQMWQEEGMLPAQVLCGVKKKKKKSDFLLLREMMCILQAKKTDHYQNNCEQSTCTS